MRRPTPRSRAAWDPHGYVASRIDRRPAGLRRPPDLGRHPRGGAAPPAAARRAARRHRRIRPRRRSPTATARWARRWSRRCCAGSAPCAICSACCSNAVFPADAPRVETALLLGAAQILWLEVPDHAAVDLSVRLVQADRRGGHYAGLVNAVLRRVAREGAQRLARPRHDRARHAGLADGALAAQLRRRDRARDRRSPTARSRRST